MAFMGTFEAHLRRNLALHISCFYWSSWWTDSARNSRSTANETFGTLVGGFQACQCARKFERDPRDVFPRESGGRSCPETSHNRKIYVRPKPGKKEDTSTVCRVAKTTFYYTTQTTSKKQYQRKPSAHPSYLAAGTPPLKPSHPLYSILYINHG